MIVRQKFPRVAPLCGLEGRVYPPYSPLPVTDCPPVLSTRFTCMALFCLSITFKLVLVCTASNLLLSRIRRFDAFLSCFIFRLREITGLCLWVGLTSCDVRVSSCCSACIRPSHERFKIQKCILHHTIGEMFLVL